MNLLYQILIVTIPHRHGKLCGLLKELDNQMEPRVGALVYRDNLESSYGAKCGTLVAASQAEYVSFIDDDDMVAPDFIERVLTALDERPDYVGFPVRWTSDGVEQLPVEHSLRHGRWENRDDILLRDLSEKNPIRRELALLGPWDGGYEAEKLWADGVRASGRVRTEAWIDKPMYYYQYSPGDYFRTPREPMPEMSPLPSYPWLEVL